MDFVPEDGSVFTWVKTYPDHNNYSLKINFDEQKIDYGNIIGLEDSTTCNFKAQENFVVLECVNRLLEKGYKPKNITLEKRYPSGHGHSGRLDICVSRDDGSEYLLIECKTWGKAFEKEFAKLNKDGGQLFTYFKFSNKADIIMLYTSQLNKKKIIFNNRVIKIEDEYRVGDVKDFYEKWNKLKKDNGVFDEWVAPYEFLSKALTPELLKEIKQEDSSFIFNQFLEILRHNVVSDKSNAFNKIFTLFLCKIYDEKTTHANEELKFQWKEGSDNHITFQTRLADLYKKGMFEFLDKEITDFADSDFDNKYGSIHDDLKRELRNEIIRLRLEKNNEFAIKEVFDNKSFKENAKVVKQVVELLQGFKIRYTKKQQYLSDFFELLLTTGLKQESGQFFTPVPVAQFIIKSIPTDELIYKKLNKGEKGNLLPHVMDYAAGSGHFLTEMMHEIQRALNKQDPSKYIKDTSKKIKSWQEDQFDWASQYVYGIEKDYRLVKVGKVGCYLHGDGLANVVHSDGLGSFKREGEFEGKLKEIDVDFPKENKQFDIVASNPPYSVSAFRQDGRNYYTEEDFELYKYLTDNSSEIECLFVERTKQLLKDGGVAGIILPSSILSNTGIYTKTRELILQYFEIIAIAALGSNTFMATGTNTVTLFLRRRSNYDSINLKKSIDVFFTNFQDKTINKIEQPIEKYINYTWEDISFEDYLTLLKKKPNKNIEDHEIYIEYRKKIRAKSEKEFWNAVIELENEKIYYFILVLQQKVVLVNTGEKKEEKQFLGYEFSNRRGNEGIHPAQRGKSIEECTKLFDPESFDNPEKASTYIYRAFQGDYESEIDDSLQSNISRHNLVDMLTFDQVNFEKNISLCVKKKIKSKWKLVKLGAICSIEYGNRIVKAREAGFDYPVYGGGRKAFRYDVYNRENQFVISRFGISSECMRYVSGKFFLNDSGMTLKSNSPINQSYLDRYLYLNQFQIFACGRGVAQKNIDIQQFKNIKIPLPPKSIQEKIVDEIEVLETEKVKTIKDIEKLKSSIANLINDEKNIKRIDLKNVLEVINPVKSKELENIEGNMDISFLSMSDISNNGEILNLQKKKLKEVQTGYTFFQEQDVLLAKITPCMENGKRALVPKLENNIGFGSTEFFVLRRDPKKILSKLLFYIISSENFRQEAKKKMTGSSGHKRVPKSFIEKFSISNFSIPKQQEIVAHIEGIEQEIAILQKQLNQIPEQKENILRKYLF